METKQYNNDEIEIDLREVFILLLSKAWLIALVGMLTAIIGFVLSAFVIAPTFESTSKIYILNKQQENTVTYSDVQLGTQLTKDYAQLITSRLVLEKVIEDLNLTEINEDIDYEAMLDKVEVTTPTDTRILSITFLICTAAASLTLLAISIAKTGAVSVTVMDKIRVSVGVVTSTLSSIAS